MNGGIVMEWRDKIDDPIQEFGGRVMQELFQTLPGEKVLIKK